MYRRPRAEPVLLSEEPRLTSWMGKDHPDQLRLQAYLDSAERAVFVQLGDIKGPVAMSLDVGLPAMVNLLDGYDLDNYLEPLARRLSKVDRPIVSAWATKRISDRSYLTVEPAVGYQSANSELIGRIEVSASSDSSSFKESIRLAVADLEPLPPGPVSLEVSYVVGPTRNWINLWKPTIDSLGPLLGETPRGRLWNPFDGRIVELSLHCAVDASVGNTVSIGFRSAPPKGSRSSVGGGIRFLRRNCVFVERITAAHG